MHKQVSQIGLVLILLLLTLTTLAQDNPPTPSITVREQVISANSLTIDEVISDDFGFIVIHAQNAEGNIGAVIGLALIHAGVNQNIIVDLDMINVTASLYARLHYDTEPYGDFQFGQVDDADMPVTLNDEAVGAEFDVIVISIHDQFVDPDNFNRIVVDIASAQNDAWLVAHAENADGSIGDVLGHTFLPAGVAQDIPILLSGDVTATIFVLLHEDTSAPERYEFGENNTADIPILIDDLPALTEISTVPTIRFNNQLAIGSDLTRSNDEFVPVVVNSVLSEGATWLVIYANTDNAQSEVIGFAPVQHGYNHRVIVQVPQASINYQLFAMLHEDTNEALVYEFDDVEDADLPVLREGKPIIASAIVVPYINEIATLNRNSLTIHGATIDTTGWLVIYQDNTDGETGEVIAYAPLNTGYNPTITVEIPSEQLENAMIAMLHYDSRPVGIYDLSTDSPLIFEGNPISVQLIIEG